MRIVTDISAEQTKKLDEPARARKSSRAALIREAISAYLAVHRPEERFFGLWGDHLVDFMTYQETIREEW